jgi:hypothetical protein
MTPDDAPHEHHNAGGTENWSRLWWPWVRRYAARTVLVVGIGKALCDVAGWALSAEAQESRDLSGSTITLQHTQRPGAEAEVHFDNLMRNGMQDEIGFDLTLNGLSVMVHFDWNVTGDDDAILVTPPEGYTCEPVDCKLTLSEGDKGTLWLFSIEGVGM